MNPGDGGGEQYRGQNDAIKCADSGDKIADATPLSSVAGSLAPASAASASPILPVEPPRFCSVQLGITCALARRLSFLLSLPILRAERRQFWPSQLQTFCGVIYVYSLDLRGAHFPFA
jgi:hypothetical protein